MPYYIIENTYVGPNQQEHIDRDTIEISTVPALTNMGREPKTAGWCGTTNDNCVYAFGEYETLEEARDALFDRFGDVRDLSDEAHGGVIEIYKPGNFEPMSRSETGSWAWEGIKIDISHDTTDERIDDLVIEYEVAANLEGSALDPDVLREDMLDRRQVLIDEREELEEVA